ncbi:MAG: hypothetical protein IKJ42_07815 [Bacteroidaceae bacterium]|nr:hypothetical protein [Bacteroidaceae bacterium]
MSYLSIDTLQKVLSEEVFSHTEASKKAAGRALGTMIEIISFYLLKEWGIEKHISIERGLEEYGNPVITHNVEFTLHPFVSEKQIKIPFNTAITANKITKSLNLGESFTIKSNTLLTKDFTLKNACVIAENESTILLSKVNNIANDEATLTVFQQMKKPYAMFECKRVGVEEGNKKGPQTIEKAKQGAYVAKTISSLQKIRDNQGNMCGLIFDNSNAIIKPYSEMLQFIINGENENLLKDFTLSVGIVSNHGNWFTSQDQNKELKVLAQSYDWLLFLTDDGLAQFVSDLLLNPPSCYKVIQKAFHDSYKEGKKSNVFTKVKMNYDAHLALIDYFHKNIGRIEKWFNIITPEYASIENLKKDLSTLNQKDWKEIL